MNHTKVFAIALLTCSILLNGEHAAAQASPPVRVFAWGMHLGGQIVYKYRIQNSGAYPIDRIFIGFYPPTATADGAAELTVAPYFPERETMWLPPRVSNSPAGWGVNLSFPDESATFALDWIEASHYRKMRPGANHPDIPVAQNPPNIMPPGATWDQFSVTLPEPDLAYIHGHANFAYGLNDITVEMEKGDTTPPILSLTLTPTQQTENDKLVPVTASISVNDDYDPQPEIKLESITANEVLEAEDIQGAQYGQDVRQFSLKADVEHKNLPNRIYTITYSAEDGSGNKSIATATFTVHPESHEGNDEHAKETKSDGAPKQKKPDTDKRFWQFW